jgi:hypothetical protein
MILSLFIFILVLLIIIFCSYKKKLHLFEIIFIWMTVWLITHSVSSILIANLKVLALSPNLSDFWVHFFKRLLLYPLIIVLFFDIYLRINRVPLRIILLCINIVLFTLFEFLFIRLGILINKNFNMGMALIEWTFTILLTYLSWLWYRNNRLMR